MTIEIKNIQGVFYINGKRLGHDDLSLLEIKMLNEFIMECKDNLKAKPDDKKGIGKSPRA